MTGRFRSADDFKGEGDLRSSGLFPRYTADVWEHNFKLVQGAFWLISSHSFSPLSSRSPFPAALEALAKEKGCTSGQLALAWDMQVHGDTIIPIPGVRPFALSARVARLRSLIRSPSAQTKSIKYLDENWASQNVNLSQEDFDRIRRILKENPVKGAQFSAALDHLADKS